MFYERKMMMMNLLKNSSFLELKNHINFDPDAKTLEQLMLKGESSGTWITICEKLGRFLAEAKNHFNANEFGIVDPDIQKLPVLVEWIEKMIDSWDSISSMAPERLKPHLNMGRIKERGMRAAELLKKPKVPIFDNFLTKNVELLPDQQDVQIDSNEVQLIYGPLGLDSAVFLADILIKYHQQLRLDHCIRYITSACAKSFGREYNETRSATEDEMKMFWKQTSLLAGWEVIRRVILDENLHALSIEKQFDLSDVFETGLRLVYNDRIDNISFMIVVALAEL